MVDVRCVHCGEPYHVEDSHLGKQIRCVKCGALTPLERKPLITPPPPIVVPPAVPPDFSPCPGPPKATPVTVSARLHMAQRLREATRGFQLGRRPMMLLGLLIGILLMMGIYGWLGPSAETPSAPNTETETASPRKPAASVAAASAPEGAPDDGGISQQYAPAPSARPRPVPPRPSELPCTAGKATERLYTGERLEEDAGSDGHCPLEIDNGTDGDAVIRVVEGGTNQTVRLFYVRSGESYKLRNIEPGDYEVMWETGNGWVSFCKTFAHDVGYSRFRTPLSFTMGWSEKQERPYCDGTGVTLYEVPEGNIKKKVISRNEFLRGDPYLSTGQ